MVLQVDITDPKQVELLNKQLNEDMSKAIQITEETRHKQPRAIKNIVFTI